MLWGYQCDSAVTERGLAADSIPALVPTPCDDGHNDACDKHNQDNG